MSTSTVGVEDLRYPSPNIFGAFRYLLIISPFNCSKTNPLRIICMLLSLAIFLSMKLRIIWMLFVADSGSIISIGWSERNFYAFITFESFACVIALYRWSSLGSLPTFEAKVGAMKAMRNKKFNEVHDNYTPLIRRMVIFMIPIIPSFLASALWLGRYKLTLFGTDEKSNWYYIFNLVVAFFCAYVNVIFLPLHALMQSAIRREFDVFNEELGNSSQNKELDKLAILQRYGDRQLKLFEFANTISTRLDTFMTFAPFTILTALINGSYLTTGFIGDIWLSYQIILMVMTFVTIVIFSFLTVGPGMIQESMLRTSNILLSDSTFQQATDPKIYQTYRLMVDRSIHNRHVNNVIFIFAVTKKNIERAFFMTTQIVLALCIAHEIIVLSKKAAP